jgi:hypothetical protein
MRMHWRGSVVVLACLLGAAACSGGYIEDQSLPMEPAAPQVADAGVAANREAAPAAAESAPPVASGACLAAEYARQGEVLYGQLLMATNELDNPAALTAVGAYISSATFVGETAAALCRAPLTTPNPDLCRSLQRDGIALLRESITVGEAIRAAGEGEYFVDTASAEAALDEASTYAGSASATLEVSLCQSP